MNIIVIIKSQYRIYTILQHSHLDLINLASISTLCCNLYLVVDIIMQCRNGAGACPDALDRSGSCTDDVTVLGGVRDNGVQWISFKKPFMTSE